MAIEIDTTYPGQSAASNSNYPQGSFQNITVSGDNTGTPYDKNWPNDIFGFLQALLLRSGVTASGLSDTAQVSDYMSSLALLCGTTFDLRSDMVAADWLQDGQTVKVRGKVSVFDGLSRTYQVRVAGWGLTADGVRVVNLPSLGGSAQAVCIDAAQPGDIQITAQPGGTRPGWLYVNSDLVLSRTAEPYADLFAVLGTQYGVGDGSTTYDLPLIAGRALIGAGSGTSLTARVIGATIGEETHIMTEAELAAHRHFLASDTNAGENSTDSDLTDSNSFAKQNNQSNNEKYALRAAGVADAEVGLSSESGGSDPFNVMQPSTAIPFYIKL